MKTNRKLFLAAAAMTAVLLSGCSTPYSGDVGGVGDVSDVEYPGLDYGNSGPWDGGFVPYDGDLGGDIIADGRYIRGFSGDHHIVGHHFGSHGFASPGFGSRAFASRGFGGGGMHGGGGGGRR